MPTQTARYLKSAIIVSTLTIAGCGGSGDSNQETPAVNPNPVTNPNPGPNTNPNPGTQGYTVFAPDPTDLILDRSIYQQDGYGTVDIIRANVRIETNEGICTIDDQSGCTLDDVIADTDRSDAFKVDIPVHFTSDDFPDDGTFTNAQLRQRGGTTRYAPQKSFRIKLDNKEALWRGERSLLLNKHPYESSRVRNKLAFDLMSGVPHLLSFRTQLFNLWMDNSQGLENYGLFTHVEAPGKNYLTKRGLDKDDRMYKANFFNFSENALHNMELDAEGRPLDVDRFESFLEIEAGKDHRPLVKMLTDMHDPTRTFDSILDQYFNRNNVLTWITVNFLFHQTDAVTHNYILYNPKGTEKFYFVPWDYDGGFVGESEPPMTSMDNNDLVRRLYYGYSRGFNSHFITEYYKLPGIHEDIVEASDILRENYLTDDIIGEKSVRYGALVVPHNSISPDIEHNPGYHEFATRSFVRFVAGNHEALKTRFSIPMPPKLLDPIQEQNSWIISWTPAIEVTGSNVSYELLISSSKDFSPESIVHTQTGIQDSIENITVSVDDSILPSGRYYVRVIARADIDPARFWQVPSNYVRENGDTFFGMHDFTVP